MRVTVSCGTKFHSDYMSEQLHQRGLLARTITAHPASRYLDRTTLTRSEVTFLPPVFLANRVAERALRPFPGLSRRVDEAAIHAFDWMARRYLPQTDVFIGWAWSSLRQMRAVKSSGGMVILEQCGSFSAFQNAILREEAQRLGLPHARQHETPARLVARALAECELADYVLCPSRHVADSLASYDVPRSKLLINPYGANLDRFKPEGRTDDVFRVIYVGSVGARKGVRYLLEAVKTLSHLENFECMVVGRVEAGFDRVLDPYRPYFAHIERVPNDQLPRYYSNASVFVLPSLDEGMAYVQLEAMACGLPIVCTPNSGGESIVDDGVNGFVVPIRDADAIRQRLLALYESRDRQRSMAAASLARVPEFSWQRYGDRLSDLLDVAWRRHSTTGASHPG